MKYGSIRFIAQTQPVYGYHDQHRLCQKRFQSTVQLCGICTNLTQPGQSQNDLVDDALKIFFRNDLSAQSKQQIKTQILLTGQQWDYYWTNAWAAYVSNPTTANFNTVNTRLKSLFQYLFNLSAYQLA